MRIGIIGAGAIGSVVGGLLTKAGHDVSLIDQWPEHVETMMVSPPQRVAHVIFSTSSSIEEETAELPMLALIFTRNCRPMIIGSVSG